MEILKKYLIELESLYSESTSKAEDPIFLVDKHYARFRHQDQTDVLFCFLKGVKIISSLNASYVLLSEGYTQEIPILFRCVDDYFADIMFLSQPLEDGEPSKDQVRVVGNFFKEEYEDFSRPIGSLAKRDVLPRKKIYAVMSELVKKSINPSDMQKALKVINQSFSGYVHGAYPQVMELYGGRFPKYHMSGMLGTPRIKEWEDQFVIYLERAMLASQVVFRKMECDEQERSLRKLLSDFTKEMNLDTKTTPEEMLKKYKKKRN